MKTNFKKLAFFMLLSVALTGCQKEFIEMPNCPSNELGMDSNLNTSVTGNLFVINGDVDMAALEGDIRQLIESGYTVVIKGSSSVGTKKSETFTSHDWNEVFGWATKKEKEGYEVTFSLDKETGLYTCIAIK